MSSGSQISQLTSASSISTSDYIPIVTNTTGTPLTQKTTIGVLLNTSTSAISGSIINLEEIVSDIGGSIVTLESNSSALETQIKTGWTPDSDTWVYVSATSIKVAGKNVTYKFPAGTKIKFDQTTTKYFYVVSATFSTDTTLVLMAGSTGVTVANAAISNFYYTHAANATGMSFGTSTFIPLTSPLTSTSWDGDSFSTTSKTLIDLSEVFGVPAGVKAVNIKVSMRDSDSADGSSGIVFGPNATAWEGRGAQVSGIRNDAIMDFDLTVPCDVNGDIYYQTFASGTNTLDVS